MSGIIFLLTFSFPLFLVALFMPRWKWLLAYFTIISVLFGYVAYEYHSTPMEMRGNDIFGLLFEYVIYFGACIGTLTRASTIWMKNRGKSTEAIALATLGGFLTLIILPMVPELLNKWERRAPSAECQYEKINLTLGVQRFSIPSVPIFSFYIDEGVYAHSMGDVKQRLKYHYYFLGPQTFRKFCDDFDNGKAEIRAKAIRFGLAQRFGYQHDTRYQGICSAPHSGWPKELCGSDFKSDTFLTQINLYVTGQYTAGNFGVSGQSMKSHLQSIKPSLPLAGEKAEIFHEEKFHYTYWRAARDGLKDPEGDPLVVRCHENNISKNCTAHYALDENLTIIYSMPLNDETFEEELQMYQKKAHEFVERFKRR